VFILLIKTLFSFKKIFLLKNAVTSFFQDRVLCSLLMLSAGYTISNVVDTQKTCGLLVTSQTSLVYRNPTSYFSISFQLLFTFVMNMIVEMSYTCHLWQLIVNWPPYTREIVLSLFNCQLSVRDRLEPLLHQWRWNRWSEVD